jgi:hypothetical protein
MSKGRKSSAVQPPGGVFRTPLRESESGTDGGKKRVVCVVEIELTCFFFLSLSLSLSLAFKRLANTRNESTRILRTDTKEREIFSLSLSLFKNEDDTKHYSSDQQHNLILHLFLIRRTNF